jgi:hypothetical protein
VELRLRQLSRQILVNTMQAQRQSELGVQLVIPTCKPRRKPENALPARRANWQTQRLP